MSNVKPNKVPVLVQLYKFLTDKEEYKSNNAWLSDDMCEIYVRRARKKLLKPGKLGEDESEWMDCLDLANINVHKPGEKYFSEVILPGIKIMLTQLTALNRDESSDGHIPVPIFVENVHNGRFFKFLQGRCFTRVKLNGEDTTLATTKHLIWWPPTERITLWCNDYCTSIDLGKEVLKGNNLGAIGCWPLGRGDLYDLSFDHKELNRFGLMICVDGKPIFTYKHEKESRNDD